MNELVNNEGIFSGPVLIAVTGDQEAGRQYEQRARILLAQVLTTNGVNERIAAGDPGGFYFSTEILEDGTRIVAQTNNGLHSVEIVPVVRERNEPVKHSTIEEEEQIVPCARAGVRYYNVQTMARSGYAAVSYKYRAPIINPDPRDRGPGNDAYGGGPFPTSYNPCIYVNEYIKPEDAWGQFGYYSGYAFSCNYEDITVEIPSVGPTPYTPEVSIQLVAAGKIAFRFKDSQGNSRITVLNNDADFTVFASLTYPQFSIAEIGFPDANGIQTDAFRAVVRAILPVSDVAQQQAPITLLFKDIEYVTNEETYYGTVPPTQFRFSRDLFDTSEVLDYSGKRSIFFNDPDDAVCVTQYGKWKVNNGGLIESVPFDLDKDPPGTTWPITGPSENAVYSVAMLAHDMALDCIVGIAVRNAGPGGAFVFFVVDTLTGVTEEVAEINIGLADFLPGEELSIRPGLVKSFLAGEGVAVVSFGSTFDESGIGANRIAVIEYCDPADEGTKSTVQIVKDYVGEALVGGTRIPIEK